MAGSNYNSYFSGRSSLSSAVDEISIENPLVVSTGREEFAKAPSRYTKVEVKALIHAKLRMEVLQKFGFIASNPKAADINALYTHYLNRLDPFTEYQERKDTALLRKYKSLKTKHIRLYDYFDPRLDNGFWYQLKLFITEPISGENSNLKAQMEQPEGAGERTGYMDVVQQEMHSDLGDRLESVVDYLDFALILPNDSEDEN